MHRSRRSVIGSIAGGTVAGLAGCLGSSSNSSPSDVSLLLNWKPSGLHVPYYAAASQGFYEEQDLSVSIEAGEGSDFSARQVGLGNSDLGITSSDQVVNINTREVSPTAVGVIMQRSPVVVFAARSQFGSELTSADQLADATVGSGPGMVRLMTQSYLAEKGILDGVEYVDTGFDTVQQVLTGEVDAAGGVFGDVVDARHQDATVDVLRVSEAIPSYGHVVASHDSFMDSNPDVVRGFLRATARGAAWAHANPEAATDALVEAVPELEEVRANQRDKWLELAENYMLTDAVRENGWGLSQSEPWAQTYELLQDADSLGGELDPDTIWTNEYLDTDFEYIGEYATQVSG
jgi:NitT/TauT family transport system substrate-binding protein